MTSSNPDAHKLARRVDRRELLKFTGAGVAVYHHSTVAAQTMSNEWDKTFQRSDKVDHQKITFRNRYGI
jgi:hypothetical protein